MTPFHLLVLFVSGALSVMGVILLINVYKFPRLGNPPQHWEGVWPRVSVLIPARDEAVVIRETIQSLVGQDYPYLEVIILDDHSSDGTGDLARSASRKATVLHGADLPDGWAGKNWACHQMAQVAKGEIFLFTDADVHWSPEGLSALIADMTARRADLYSVWSTQETVTWTERLCVPLMAMVILGYLPLIGVHYIPLGAFGAANGQCMAWRKNAYNQIGGHNRVRGNVLEDVTLARMVKSAKMRLRMGDGAGLVTCRMYQNWREVKNGYAKNILAGYGSPFALMLGTIFHWLIFIVPPIAMIVALVTGENALMPALLTLLGIIIRAVSASFSRQRIFDAVFMPVSALLMTRIALQALYWHYTQGGPTWKGRVVTARKKS